MLNFIRERVERQKREAEDAKREQFVNIYGVLNQLCEEYGYELTITIKPKAL